MPNQDRRQSFRATSSTVTYWVMAGLVVYFVRPLIPPVVNQRLADSKSGFVRQAAKQHIDWQDMSPDVFTRAQASGKPVFVFIGTEWSELSSEIDDRILNSVDVAERLNRDFISVRLDAQRFRKWSSCFVQLTRAESGWEPHNQVIFFSPTGSVLRVLDFPPNTRALDDIGFIRTLDEVRFPGPSNERLITQTTQDSEYKTLAKGYEQAVPDPEDYIAKVLENMSPDHPGAKFGNTQILQARDYAFLEVANERDVVRKQIYSLLARPAYSWLDGCFFRGSRDLDWRSVTLSQSAGRNADMLEVLGSLNQSGASPYDRLVADRLFVALRDRFIDDGQFYAASLGTLSENRKSPRYSLSLGLARRTFGNDFGKAVKTLGLDGRLNPLLIPVTGRWPIERPAMEEFLDLVGRAQDKMPQQSAAMAGQNSLDVGARVTTALLRYAALTQNEEFLASAFKAAGEMQVMRSGDSDVRHSTDQDIEEPYLGDYLNFAEMELTMYRVFGDFSSLQVGRAVLDRAQFLFAPGTPGIFVNGKFTDYGPVGSEWAIPKLVDDDLPATCAQLADLLRAYASLENNPATREAMRAKSDLILRVMAPAATKLSKQVASFNIAALMARSDLAIFSVGPDCVKDARGWDWMAGKSWTYPVLASVRPDLQSRGHGYYVESHGRSRGPLSLVQLKAALIAAKGPNPSP